MSRFAEDAKHHRGLAATAGYELFYLISKLAGVNAARDRIAMSYEATEKVHALVESIEAAAVANVMHLLRTRLDGMKVDGPARAALEELLREES